MTNPLDRAIKSFPTQDAFAKAMGVQSPSVSEWKSNGIPPTRCPLCEQLTGVTCEELLPNLDWTRVDGVVTGYHVRVAPSEPRKVA